VPASAAEVQVVSRQDSVGIVRREILDLNRVRVAVGAVVGRLEADRVYLYTIRQRNSDAGLIVAVLVPFVPWLLTFEEKVSRNFLPSAASTWHGLGGLNARFTFMKINPYEPVHVVNLTRLFMVVVVLFGIVRVENDLAQLKFVRVVVAKHKLEGVALDVEACVGDRLPSFTVELRVHVAELLILSIDEVVDFDLLRIAMRTIVRRFEAKTVDLQLLAFVKSHSDPGFI
jgi:hypothetical protein